MGATNNAPVFFYTASDADGCCCRRSSTRVTSPSLAAPLFSAPLSDAHLVLSAPYTTAVEKVFSGVVFK